jgi:mannitol-specific phosphotransferase system IIBC component
MANLVSGGGTKAGTAGGTLLSVLVNINSGDILHTCVLAAVGALVSFTVSILLKVLFQRFKRKHPPPKGM